jgi:hypothetical protein
VATRVEEFSERNSGRTVSFVYVNSMAETGTYRGVVVGWYGAFTGEYVVVEPEIEIGEFTATTPGNAAYHWNLTCGQRHVLVRLELLTLSPEPKTSNPLPHKCPECGNPALIIFRSIDCSSSMCRFHANKSGAL